MKNKQLSVGDLMSIGRVGDDPEQKSRVLDIISQAEVLGTPVKQEDGKALFIYRGECKSVGLIGDMTGWEKTILFTRVNGTDLFYLEQDFPMDARLQYMLEVISGIEEEKSRITDPLNPYRVANGLGLMSELAMPGYQRNYLFKDFTDGRAGGFDRLVRHILPEGRLPYLREIYIYLPPGYSARKNSRRRYPVVYFQDGPDYIRYAHTPFILDRLIDQGETAPVIGVFVTPPNLHLPVEPNRATEYGLNKSYLDFFCNELVPHIDEQYRTSCYPERRMVTGDSYGGLVSTWIAFSRPDIFGIAYSQSGYHSFGGGAIIKDFEQAEKKNIRLILDVGTFETRVGADFLPDEETDFLTANRRFKQVLLEKGYDFNYQEYNEGHTWGNWREHLVGVLRRNPLG